MYYIKHKPSESTNEENHLQDKQVLLIEVKNNTP